MIGRFIIAPMTESPTLAKLLQYAIEGRLLEVHTALIAKVESYDAEKQVVDVSPAMYRYSFPGPAASSYPFRYSLAILSS